MNRTLQPASVRRVLALAGALAVMTGGAAFAQQSKNDEPFKGSFDQPLQNDDNVQEDSTSSMMMSENDGEHSYTVKIDNGKVVNAEVDGKKIPKSRVKNKGGKVQIMDEDGNVLKTFNVNVVHGLGAAGGHLQGVPGMVQIQQWGQNGGGAGAGGPLTLPMEQPRVMMGITMSDAADGDSGAVVDSVMDGLPASKAGLQAGDRITSADGKKVEGQQGLRDILKEKNPGDSVELKVNRDGKNKTITIKLAKFEGNKLGMFQGQTPMGSFYGLGSDHHEAFEQAKKSLQKALDELAANENLKPEKMKAKATEALKQAIEALDQAKERVSSQMNDLHGELGKLNDGQWRIFSGEGGKGGTFVVPGQPTPEAGVGKQLEKLSEQLDRLSRRLDQLEKDKK